MSVPSTAAYLPPNGTSAADLLVEIVADGGSRLGFGHIGRCLALWEELDGQAAFRVSDEAVAGFLQARGVGPALQSATASAAPIVLLDRAAPSDEQTVRSLQLAGRRVVLLDDLGPGRMVADAVIDPPTAAAWPPAKGQRLAGFEHVLLRREVRECAHVDAVISASGEKVLLAMGGSDPAGLTAPLSEALLQAGIDLSVALGPGYRGARPSGSAPIDPTAFISTLAGAALLVCGYGHSLLEAAYLGIPAISVVFREEHLPHARAFCREGTACMLDMSAGPRPADLFGLLNELLADGHRRARMTGRGRELVDGAGAARIAAALRALA